MKSLNEAQVSLRLKKYALTKLSPQMCLHTYKLLRLGSKNYATANSIINAGSSIKLISFLRILRSTVVTATYLAGCFC